MSQLEKDLRDSLLFTAIRMGNLEGVKEALAQGASLHRADDKGGRNYTPLHVAVARNLPEIAEFLISKGANIEAPDGGGDTPLMTAVVAGHEKIIALLLSCNADINARGEHGYTAAMRAAVNNLRALEILIKAGADINAADDQGQTPLMLTIKNALAEPENIGALLSAGPDLEIKDKDGHTAFAHAVLENFPEAMRLLVEAGAEIDPVNEKGLTPATLAGKEMRGLIDEFRKAAMDKELRIFKAGLPHSIKATKPLTGRMKP